MRLIMIAAAALVLCVSFGREIDAQSPSLDVQFHKAEVDVARGDAKVQQWSRHAQISWTVVIVITGLGILTAAVQAIKFKGQAFVTALIGGLVSGATVFSASTLPADYKTLNSLVSEGSELVASARVWLEKGRMLSVDDRVFALKEISSYIEKLDELDITKRKKVPGPQAVRGLMPVVHAAEPESSGPLQCDCAALLQRRSRSAGDLMACATAAGPTLREAHSRAVADASKMLAAQLRSRMKKETILTSEQLADFVQRFATEDGSCPGAGKAIQLSVMLRLHDTFAYEETIAAFARRGAPARLKVPSIRVIEDGSAGETAWKFDILVDGRVVGQIPARDYTDRPAAQATVRLTGNTTIELPVELPKGNYWLVEIKGQRTFGADTAIGAAAVSGTDKPVEIAVANAVARNGSFVFTVEFGKSGNQAGR